jgi:hypothetical protein
MSNTPIFDSLCADFATRGIKYEYLATPTVLAKQGVVISKRDGDRPVVTIVDECETTVPMPKVSEDFSAVSTTGRSAAYENFLVQRYGGVVKTDRVLVQFADRPEYQIPQPPFKLIPDIQE